MIEPAAAALVAERATGADLAMLEQAYRAMEAVDHGSDAAIEVDLRFHRAWPAATTICCCRWVA